MTDPATKPRRGRDPGATKGLAIMIVLLLCAVVRAEPDIAGAIESAERIREQVKQAEARAKAMEGLYDSALSSRIAADKAHAIEIKTLNEKHADEVSDLNGRIEELADARGKLPAYINMLIGGGITLLAAFVMIFGDMRSGLRLLAVGLLISSIGYAMLLLGFWYAVAGLTFSVVCVLGVIVWEVRASRQHKVAGEEIIDGLQQAMNVGEVTLTPGLRAIMNAAQSSFTKKRVDQITKGRK